jgi:hypothetical protein
VLRGSWFVLCRGRCCVKCWNILFHILSMFIDVCAIYWSLLEVFHCSGSQFVEFINVLRHPQRKLIFVDEIQAHLTWYQSRVNNCNMRIGLRNILGVKVGVEVVWSSTLLRFLSCWVYKYVWTPSPFELTFGMTSKPILHFRHGIFNIQIWNFII